MRFLPSHRWLLNNIDGPTHFWVVDNLSKFVRDVVFEIGVSNISIVLGCLGWALSSSILLNDAVDERTGAFITVELQSLKPMRRESPLSCLKSSILLLAVLAAQIMFEPAFEQFQMYLG